MRAARPRRVPVPHLYITAGLPTSSFRTSQRRGGTHSLPGRTRGRTAGLGSYATAGCMHANANVDTTTPCTPPPPPYYHHYYLTDLLLQAFRSNVMCRQLEQLQPVRA